MMLVPAVAQSRQDARFSIDAPYRSPFFYAYADQFLGCEVEIDGFVHLGWEGGRLYLNRELAEHRAHIGSLLLRTTDQFNEKHFATRESLESSVHGYARVRGIPVGLPAHMADSRRQIHAALTLVDFEMLKYEPLVREGARFEVSSDSETQVWRKRILGPER